MINLHLHIRHAVPQDHRQISNLIFHEANTHRHLDWRSALEWLGAENYWVMEDHGQITAVFACPEDPSGVAWIRLFAYHPQTPLQETWANLWQTARSEIFQKSADVTIAAIVLKQWFQNLLIANGFVHQDNIVVLRLNDTPLNIPHSTAIQIRPMQKEDLPYVADLDEEAFGPFWRNSLDTLQRAYSQAVYATIAEDSTGVIGYQISTGNPFGAHLARLGVHPRSQRKGVGMSIVSDLIHHLGTRPTFSLSVNTQSKNAASLALYQKIGFVRTGEYFPVFDYQQKDR